MTTFREIKNVLIAAGIASYAIDDVSASNTGHVAFVRWDDLPAEGENAKCDDAFAKFAFDVADKGVLFRA